MRKLAAHPPIAAVVLEVDAHLGRRGGALVIVVAGTVIVVAAVIAPVVTPVVLIAGTVILIGPTVILIAAATTAVVEVTAGGSVAHVARGGRSSTSSRTSAGVRAKILGNHLLQKFRMILQKDHTFSFSDHVEKDLTFRESVSSHPR